MPSTINKTTISNKPDDTSGKANNSSSVLAQLESEYYQPFEKYDTVAKPAIKETLELWGHEIKETGVRRALRYIKIDSDEEKQKRNLEEDEYFTPVRLVDSNINREQAKYAQYLTESKREAILNCREDSSVDCSLLEADFTNKCRYNAWEIPLLKNIDGMQMHAWDGVEMMFDETKPGHFTIEHIGHENLIFPTDTKDFQSCDYVVRLCDYTTRDLVRFVKQRGWNPVEVQKVIAGQKNAKIEPTDDNRRTPKEGGRNFKLNKIEKVFFRGDDDFIYVAWSCSTYCDDWLRPPQPLFIGNVMQSNDGSIVRLYEKSYPIEPFIYIVSENETLMDVQGRVALDEHKQEAATSLLSSFVTGHRRAAMPYFSVGDGTNTGADIDEAQTTIKLKSGRLIQIPLKQWQMNPPSEGILSAINTLIGQSQMETGDVNYAIQSNKSTRKTSAEVKVAAAESNVLTSVQTSLLSISMRNVRTICFNIYSSRAKAGLIQVSKPVLELLTQYTFNVKPAGDSDVIDRQQKVSTMMQAWPVYQKTGAATVFLKKLTRLLFPDEADEYIAAFEQDDDKNVLIKKLVTLLQSIIIDPQTGQLHPEFQQYAQQLQMLEQEVQQVTMPKDGDDMQMEAAASGATSAQDTSGNNNVISLPTAPQEQLNTPSNDKEESTEAQS